MSDASPSFFVTGGTLSASAASYIERAADKALFDALEEGQFCFVLNSRQMGKSSICVRTMERLEADGVRTAFIDLTRIGGRNVSAEQWYAGIAGEIGRTLGMRAELLGYWKENADLGPMLRLFSGLRDIVLTKIPGRVAIFIDEIDATRTLPFDTDEFFAGIRECYNRRIRDPEYDRLTFCLLGVAIPSDLIANPTSTPFNIGKRVLLRDFTLEEAEGFMAGIQDQRDARLLVDRVHYWTNGHPFLTQTLCQMVAQSPQIRSAADVDGLVKSEFLEPKALDTNINLADVANRALNAGANDPEPDKFRADLLSLYKRAIEGQSLPDDESNRVAALLKLSGLMRSEGNRLTVRNQIYRRVFGRKWIHENMPGQELRRQRRAIFIGALRAGLVSAVILAIIAHLAIANYQLAQVALNAEHRAEYESYISDVNLMRTASQDHDSRLLGQLLDSTKSSPFRGLEWNYWKGQLNRANYQIPFPPGADCATTAAPDGKSVAITDNDSKTAQVYSMPDLKPLSPPVKMHGISGLVPASPEYLYFEFEDPHRISVYTLQTRKLLGSFRPSEYVFVNGQFSLDCTRMVQIAKRNGDALPHEIFVTEAANLKVLKHLTVKERSINYPALDYAAHRICLLENPPADPGSPVIPEPFYVVRDVATGSVIDQFRPPSEGSSRLAVTGPTLTWDGKFEACPLFNGELYVRDVDHHRVAFHTATPRPAASVEFSRDGSLLLLSNADHTAEVWDWKAGRLITSEDGAIASELDPAGRFLVTVGGGTKAYLLHRSSADTVQYQGSSRILAIDEQGRVILQGTNSLSLLDPDSMKRIGPPTIFNWSTSTISRRDRYRIVGVGKGGSDVFETASGRLLFHLPYQMATSLPFDVSATSGRVATYTFVDRKIHIYDMQGRVIAEPTATSLAVLGLAFSPDGQLLAANANSEDVTLFDKDGKRVRTLPGPGSWPTNVTFSSNGRMIAVGYASGLIQTFDLAHNDARVQMLGSSNLILNLQFCDHDTRLLSASRDGTARLWDTASGREVLRITQQIGVSLNAVMTKDQSAIITCSPSGLVRRYGLSGK